MPPRAFSALASRLDFHCPKHADVCFTVLLQIEQNDYDNFNKRAYVSKERKLLQLPFLWFRTVTGGWGQE